MGAIRSLKLLLLASVASLTFSGCLGPPQTVDETAEGLGTAFANDKPAFDFFVAKGLKNFQAAGIVGNLDQESGVNPASVQFGGGPGRGIAQWSVGGRWDTSANDNVLTYAKIQGESSGSLNLQLEFIWYELNTFGYGFSQLEATTNVTDATVVFMDKYEICGTCAQTQRISYAQSVLNAYGATPAYSASFVSQSWPYASQPAFTVKCGESVAGKIVLKNTGSKAWSSSTKLGTTMPRDRSSIFAGAGWLAPNRAASSGAVAPGANGTFSFSFDGPTGAACVPGTYHEFFGVVQEGVAWFSDSGQGGPPDNQIEALINLVPGPPAPPPPPPPAMDDGGTPPPSADDGGAPPTTDDGGTASAGNPDGGTVGTPGEGGAPQPLPPTSAGCSVAPGSAQGAGLGSLLLLLLCLALVRRRPERARIN
jgi:MYXO-CTERM domain-containing protein